ncbi:Acg family FMN-binding oxidoreductase [Actinoplanes subglobosus]|uniref:Acg family FMN-binding oxidoreductase n=1 Tax=Actinoplanes subglobosus TaxID=1547892 RepID=A0ABV8J215_9ACTN
MSVESSVQQRVILEDGVRAATLAPSLHNSQPWRFRIGDGVVDVFADPGRRLDVLDPGGRELMISVGAALFNLRLRLRASGRLPAPAYFPDAQQPDLIARVSVGEPVEAPEDVLRLAAAIEHRHTNRQPFARAAIPAGVLDSLTAAAAAEDAVLTVANPVSRNAIIALSQVADRRLRATGGYRAELARWTTHRLPHRDGVPQTAAGPWDALETMPIRDFGLLQPGVGRPTEAFEPYPSIMVLATTGDDRTAWVRAGQALQRVLLTATWHNLATTPISQPVEIPAIREQLTDTREGVWAQMVLRAGYGRPSVSTPRRPLGDVIDG